MVVPVISGTEIQHELEPDAVLVRIAAEAVVGILEPRVEVGVVGDVEGAADVGGGTPAAFVAGHAVAGCRFEATTDGPVLDEFEAAGEVDPELVIVAFDAGGIARFYGAVEDFALPPDRPAAELILAVDVCPGGPGGAAEAVLAGGEGEAGAVDAGDARLVLEAAEEEAVAEVGFLGIVDAAVSCEAVAVLFMFLLLSPFVVFTRVLDRFFKGLASQLAGRAVAVLAGLAVAEANDPAFVGAGQRPGEFGALDDQASSPSRRIIEIGGSTKGRSWRW